VSRFQGVENDIIFIRHEYKKGVIGSVDII
jgi:hypothetical protein